MLGIDMAILTVVYYYLMVLVVVPGTCTITGTVQVERTERPFQILIVHHLPLESSLDTIKSIPLRFRERERVRGVIDSTGRLLRVERAQNGHSVIITGEAKPAFSSNVGVVGLGLCLGLFQPRRTGQ